MMENMLKEQNESYNEIFKVDAKSTYEKVYEYAFEGDDNEGD